MRRRDCLRLLGAGLTAGVAGCEGGQEADPSDMAVGDAGRTSPGESTPSGLSGGASSDAELSVDPIDQDKLVGAFYYAWYWGDDGYAIHRERPWLEQTPYTPELGQYDSRDSDVVDRHIKWALEAGINWFVINTGHPGGPIMNSIEESFLGASLADRMHYAFDIGFDHGPVTDADGRYVVDDPRNIREYRRYFDAYAEFFEDPNYVRFDGRPVLFDFSTGRLTGDVATALSAVSASIEEDPYFIANPTGFWTPPAIDPPGRLSPDAIFDAYDAVRKYAALPPGGDEQIERHYPTHWADRMAYWRFLSDQHDTAFIPTVMPGFDDREIEWDRTHHDVLDLSPAEFRTVCERSLRYVDPDLDAVVITSWNEFPEGSTIEPTEEYGHRRLDVVRATLGRMASEPIRVDEHPLVEMAFDRTMQPAGAPQAVHLAFFLETLELSGPNGTVQSYDVGTVGEEPTFVDGAYARGSHGEHAGRWLGGPTGTAAMYVHPGAVDATAAVLTGRPISPGDITAEVSVDGERTDLITFDEQGDGAYRVSLQPA